MAEFRFVFLVDRDVWLMPNAADDAGEWAFEHSPTGRVLVRDARACRIDAHPGVGVVAGTDS